MSSNGVGVFFKYALEFEGKEYKANYAYMIDLPQYKVDRLMRRGCIYASKDAKYYQEQKEEKPVTKKKVVKKKPKNQVSEDVINKDSEPAKVQAKSTDKE